MKTAVKIEQVMEKAPWFQRLSPTRTDIPVHALSDAKLYVSSPHSPGIVLATALKLCDPRLDHFRVLTSIYNPTLFTAYDKLLKLGLNGKRSSTPRSTTASTRRIWNTSSTIPTTKISGYSASTKN